MNKSFFIKYKINTDEEEETILVQAPNKITARRIGIELIEMLHSINSPIIVLSITDKEQL